MRALAISLLALALGSAPASQALVPDDWELTLVYERRELVLPSFDPWNFLGKPKKVYDGYAQDPDDPDGRMIPAERSHSFLTTNASPVWISTGGAGVVEGVSSGTKVQASRQARATFTYKYLGEGTPRVVLRGNRSAFGNYTLEGLGKASMETELQISSALLPAQAPLAVTFEPSVGMVKGSVSVGVSGTTVGVGLSVPVFGGGSVHEPYRLEKPALGVGKTALFSVEHYLRQKTSVAMLGRPGQPSSSFDIAIQGRVHHTFTHNVPLVDDTEERDDEVEDRPGGSQAEDR